MIIKIYVGKEKRYALVVDDVVLYIGKTAQEVRERLKSIRRK